MQQNVILQAIASSAASSCLTATLLQPLDRLKTLKQQLNGQHKSSLQLLKVLVAKEGPLSLWNGLSPTLLRVVPGASLYLCIVDQLRRRLNIQDHNSIGLLLTGLGSRTMIASLMQPTIVVKTRLESSVYKQTSVIGVVRGVLKETGLKGLWRGLLPTLLRDAPFSGLYLLFYRRQLHLFNANNEEQSQFLYRMACGMSAGLMACFLTQPFDIIRTVVLLYPQKFETSIGASKDLYKSGGARVFFTGFLLRASKRTLTASLNWALFEELLAYHRNLKDR